MISELLNERKLPELLEMNGGAAVTRDNFELRRAEMIELLAKYEYGRIPEKIGETTFVEKYSGDFCAGKAIERRVEITFPTPDGESFTFPITTVTPVGASRENKKAAFVYISFGFRHYYPIEEVSDSDVIVAEMLMNDVSLDKNDGFANLMDSHYFKDGKRAPDDTGKIGMWAFAASRVLDYLLTLDYVDETRVGVMGHSRLGKTALWAGANDERFTHIFSNEAGCSGDAITRGKVGETFPRIATVFSYWFCENMQEISKSVEESEKAPFDQHFLLAACAPRKLYVASAGLDQWADPISQYLACAAASPAWELFGKRGFVHPDSLPKEWDRFADGEIGYHLRPGKHWLSRHDWVRFIEFLKK